jgi:hypothetical protein
MEGKPNGLIITVFHVEHSALFTGREVNRLAVKARGRACLQPAHPESKRPQRLRECDRRWLTVSPSGRLFTADMDDPIQKRARRDDQRPAAYPPAILEHQSRYSVSSMEHRDGSANQPLDLGYATDSLVHPRRIVMLVGLRAR